MTTVTIHSERTQVEIDTESRVVEVVTRGERRVEIAKVGLRGPPSEEVAANLLLIYQLAKEL